MSAAAPTHDIDWCPWRPVLGAPEHRAIAVEHPQLAVVRDGRRLCVRDTVLAEWHKKPATACGIIAPQPRPSCSCSCVLLAGHVAECFRLHDTSVSARTRRALEARQRRQPARFTENKMQTERCGRSHLHPAPDPRKLAPPPRGHHFEHRHPTRRDKRSIDHTYMAPPSA